MKKKIFMLLLLLTPMAFANTVEFKTSNKSYRNVKADTASIVFRVESKAKTRQKAQRLNNAKLERFLKQIKKFNIDDLATRNFNISKTWDIVGKAKKVYTTEISFYVNAKQKDYENIVSKLEKENIDSYSFVNNYNTFRFILKEKSSSKDINIARIDKKIKKLEKILNTKIYLLSSKTNERNEYNREYNYKVGTQVYLKLKDIKNLNELLDIANKEEIYLEGNINYTVSNLREIYIELYKESLDMAKNKAITLLGEEYKVKNVKNITENKRVEYNNDNQSLKRSSAKELRSEMEMEELAVPIEKPNLEIPVVRIENDLDVVLVLDDGKPENKTTSDFNIKSTISKSISPNNAEIHFEISTSSEKGTKYANNDNVKVLNKLKDILKLANIKYEDIETVNYRTDKEIRMVYVDNKPKKLNKTVFEVYVSGITSENYIDIVKEYNVISNNKNVKIIIDAVGKNHKQAYEKAKAKLDKLKKTYPEVKFEIYRLNNDIINVQNNERVKKEIYTVSHALKLKTNEMNKISLLISIFREMGLYGNVTYGVSNTDKYTNDLYSLVKKDVATKKEAIEKTSYVKVENIKKITEINNNLKRYFYTTYFPFRNRELVNLNKSNKEILRLAYENLENVYIENYIIHLYIDINMGIK